MDMQVDIVADAEQGDALTGQVHIVKVASVRVHILAIFALIAKTLFLILLHTGFSFIYNFSAPNNTAAIKTK